MTTLALDGNQAWVGTRDGLWFEGADEWVTVPCGPARWLDLAVDGSSFVAVGTSLSSGLSMAFEGYEDTCTQRL